MSRVATEQTAAIGRLVPALQVTLGCPVCEATMVVENGMRQTALGVGRENMLLVRCTEDHHHGIWQVRMTLARTDVKPPRLSGFQQRKRQTDGSDNGTN